MGQARKVQKTEQTPSQIILQLARGLGIPRTENESVRALTLQFPECSRAHILPAYLARKSFESADYDVGSTKASDCSAAVVSPRVSDVAAVDDSRVSVNQLIGARIRLACRLADISEYRLALQLDKRPQQVSDWVRGEHRPSDGHLARIAEIVGQPVWWFYQPFEDEP
jgi:hypothetical protein